MESHARVLLVFLRIISHDACHNYAFGTFGKNVSDFQNVEVKTDLCTNVYSSLIYNCNVNCEVINSNISHDFLFV